jgi:hypothetical protein
MTDDSDLPPLGATGQDRTLAIVRGLAGAVPVVGPLIAELIAVVIPDQRTERMEDWLRNLAERLTTLEEKDLRSRLREPENVDLFERGAYQAATTISQERREQIAELVASGIADADRNYIESRRLLRLLGELDDVEIIILAGYLQKNTTGEYRTRHAAVLQVPAVHYGSSRNEMDAAAVGSAGRQHLVQLGLLEHGAIAPEASTKLTHLGRLLLRRIGLATQADM